MILFTAPTIPGTENPTHLITPTGITRAEALTDEEKATNGYAPFTTTEALHKFQQKQ